MSISFYYSTIFQNAWRMRCKGGTTLDYPLLNVSEWVSESKVAAVPRRARATPGQGEGSPWLTWSHQPLGHFSTHVSSSRHLLVQLCTGPRAWASGPRWLPVMILAIVTAPPPIPPPVYWAYSMAGSGQGVSWTFSLTLTAQQRSKWQWG